MYNPSLTIRLYIYDKEAKNLNPDSKVHVANVNVHVANVLSAPDGPHVGPMDLAIRELMCPIIYVLTWSRNIGDAEEQIKHDSAKYDLYSSYSTKISKFVADKIMFSLSWYIDESCTRYLL